NLPDKIAYYKGENLLTGTWIEESQDVNKLKDVMRKHIKDNQATKKLIDVGFTLRFTGAGDIFTVGSLHNIAKNVNPQLKGFIEERDFEKLRINTIGVDFFNESEVVPLAIARSLRP